MAQPKNKQESRLQELILTARQLNIQVRTEKLLAGSRDIAPRAAAAGINGQDVILIDRDARISDQIDFLSACAELARHLANRSTQSRIISATCRPSDSRKLVELDAEFVVQWTRIFFAASMPSENSSPSTFKSSCRATARRRPRGLSHPVEAHALASN